jgi:hypothetical protein
LEMEQGRGKKVSVDGGRGTVVLSLRDHSEV